MILAKVKFIGGEKQPGQTLLFRDGMMPRLGEYVMLGNKTYKIFNLIHLFGPRENPGAWEDEKFIAGIPCLQITLRED